MKLNFTTLASQLKSNPQKNQQAVDISSQLNYYRRPVIHEQSNKIIKQRKSQLQAQQQSTIVLGSSILTDYFSSVQSKQPQKQIKTPTINLSVMYPYEISTTIDPSNVDDKIQSMKSKGILDQSAMKFIKRQITKSLSKSKQKQKKQQSNKIIQLHQSVYLQNENLKAQQSENNENFLKETQDTLRTDHSLNIDPSTKNLLFKKFSKEFLSTEQKKSNQKPFVMAQSSKKINSKTNLKNNDRPNYMKPIHEQQKPINKKVSKQFVSTQALKMQSQLKQLKSKPSLQLTKTSPFTFKVQAQRESKYKQKKSNVFNELYNEAYVRQCMKSLERDSIQKTIDERSNFNKILRTQYSQKYKVKESFMERLQKSIEKKYFKDYLISKYSVNEKTGQQFFKPDMTLSKHTYQNLFHRSLEKLRSQSVEQFTAEEIEAKQKDKQISVKNNQSVKQISISYKSAARTKQNSVERFSNSLEKVSHRAYDKEQKSITIDRKSMQIVSKINEKIINRIVGMFFSQKDQQIQVPSKQQPCQELIDFSTTFSSLTHQLTQKQYNILLPLIQQVQKIQQSTKVSKLMFKTLLQQFVNKLNYHDQSLLRKNVMKRKDRFFKDQINNFEKTEISTANMKKHKIINHQPKINEISSSMEKLNPKYDQTLYYV